MRRCRAGSCVVAAVAVSAALTAAPRARADTPPATGLPVTVVAIQTPDADEQADALTKALRNAVKATPGFSLAGRDYSLEVLTLSLKCPDPPDTNCESRIADQMHADRFLWGTLRKKGGTVSGELHYWERGKGGTKVPVSYATSLTDPNGDPLKKIAGDALSTLTGGPPKGALAVHAGNVSGQVFVDGQPVGALTSGEGKFFLPSGSHKITVKASGYADAETSVTVSPDGTADASLTMNATTATHTTDWRRIGGFAALGAGVAFGVVAVASSIRVASMAYSDDWKQTLDAVPGNTDDVCDAANNGTLVTVGTPPLSRQDIIDHCSTAKTFEVLQAIFYPAAAVAGGIGIFLLATSGGSSAPPTTGTARHRPNVSVTPTLTPHLGRLDVHVTW